MNSKGKKEKLDIHALQNQIFILKGFPPTPQQTHTHTINTHTHTYTQHTHSHTHTHTPLMPFYSLAQKRLKLPDPAPAYPVGHVCTQRPWCRRKEFLHMVHEWPSAEHVWHWLKPARQVSRDKQRRPKAPVPMAECVSDGQLSTQSPLSRYLLSRQRVHASRETLHCWQFIRSHAYTDRHFFSVPDPIGRCVAGQDTTQPPWYAYRPPPHDRQAVLPGLQVRQKLRPTMHTSESSTGSHLRLNKPLPTGV